VILCRCAGAGSSADLLVTSGSLVAGSMVLESTENPKACGKLAAMSHLIMQTGVGYAPGLQKRNAAARMLTRPDRWS